MSKCKFTDNEGYISSHTDVRRSQNSSGDGWGGTKGKLGKEVSLICRNGTNQTPTQGEPAVKRQLHSKSH